MATIITKTIGQDGWQDFSAIQQATDAITTSDIANTADLVAADKAVVFEIYAGVYDESVEINEGLTCDATRNVTYKPAAGSEHGGSRYAGVRVNPTTGTAFANLRDDFVVLDGLVIDCPSNGVRTIVTDGVSVRNSLLFTGGQGITADYGNTGTAAAPLTVENCVVISVSRAISFAGIYGASGPIHYAVRNCTLARTGSAAEAILTYNTNDTNYGEFTNNLVVGTNSFSQTGTNLLTGSDNIGGTAQPWPSVLRAESQTWTISTDTTAASTGSQVIYDDTTFKLINVSGNDAVGVGTGTGAPATDINGDDRIRGAANEYADPGAFTTDKVSITKILDVDGNGDFDNTVDALNGMDDALHELLGGTRNNLAQRNGEVIYAARAGVYPKHASSWNLASFDNAITGPGNSFVFQAVEGHEHKGVIGAGPVFPEDGSTSFTFSTNIPFAKFQDIQLSRVETADNRANLFLQQSPSGLEIERVIFTQDASATTAAHQIQVVNLDSTFDGHIYVNNCLFDEKTNYAFAVNMVNPIPAHFHMSNCTVLDCARLFGLDNNSVNQPASITLNNNVVVDGDLIGTQFNPPAPYPGSQGNLADSINSNRFDSSALAGSQAWTFTTDTTQPSTGNQVIYTSATGALVNVSGNDAVGVAVATLAPTTDIAGASRIRGAANEYADPGAFTTDLITATRTIGKDGWQDFTTFTNAEAEADTIANELLGGSRLNLAERNGKIVYEAYAATYQEITAVAFQDTITTGPGNAITYQAASGSEHLGVSGQGVYLLRPADSSNINFLIYSDYSTFDGLSIYNEQNNTRPITLQGVRNGVTIQNCLVHADFSNGVCVQTSTKSAGNIAPNVFENNVLRWQGNYGLYLAQVQGSETVPGKAIVNNNTFQPAAAGGVGLGFADTGSYFDVSANNNLLLSGLSMYTVGSVRITGQGNFDVQTAAQGPYEPLPENIRGAAAPITVVTETSAISTGNQAVIDVDTLALVNVSGNDIVGLGSGSAINVPANDILGNSRIRGANNEYADPGAFTTDLITATKIIDVNEGFPYDYSGFVDADDDAEEVAHELLGGTRENLAQRNGAIVFEARAGTYNGMVTVQHSSIISDATRNVTYKAAAGSEHGGLSSAGVIVNANGASRAITAHSNFVRLEDLVFVGGSAYSAWLDGAGVVARNCIAAPINRGFVAYAGTSTYPIVIENCISRGGPSHSFLVFSDNAGGPTHARLINCLGETTTTTDTFRSQVNDDVLCVAEYINCLSLGSHTHQAIRKPIVTGSNNVGGTLNRWPEATRAEGQVWTFTTDTTASSTGSQVIYDDSTGAHVNVSGNDAVGVGTGTGAPTTDILGKSRIRGADDEYADPGAFTTDLITATKIIDVNQGPGYDFSGFVEAKDGVEEVAHELLGGTRENLAQRNGAIVFEARSGVYSQTSVVLDSTITADLSHNVTYRGTEDVTISANGTVRNSDDFTVFDGIDINSTAAAYMNEGRQAVLKNCTITTGSHAVQSYAGASLTCDNVITDSYNYSFYASNNTELLTTLTLRNCTVVRAQAAVPIRLQSFAPNSVVSASIDNCLVLDTASQYYDSGDPGTIRLSGGGNVGGAGTAFPTGLRAEGQTWTFSTSATAPSTGNQVIYTSATGALLNVSGNDAIGVGDGTVAPTTDINGNDRIRGANNEYADPGAFTTDLVTFNRKIGPFREYTTFNDAENDVVAISTDGNLAQRNEAIVFEADAGNYTENFTFFTGGALTCDPTRNVTFKAAAGSEHGGEFGAGVNIIGSCSIQESFGVVDGLSVSPSTGTASTIGTGAEGAILRNLMTYSPNSRGVQLGRGGTASNPCVVENCVAKSDSSRPFDIRSDGAAESYWRIVNCTAMATGINQAFIVGQNSTANIIHLELINNVVNGGTARSYYATPGPIIVATGSNNLGPDDGSSPFPAAIQAGGQVWTTTTDTTAASTGNQVIYTSATGALVNVSGNDAVGVGTGTGAPTTDILGSSRIRPSFGAQEIGPDYADPGAFTSEVNTITKTIGPNGDFSGFAQAESALFNDTSIVYNRNLAKANIAVVVEAEAGRYVETLDTYNANFYGGPTNTVTYKAAVGSEHNGLADSGVRLGADVGVHSSTALSINLPFQIFQGLVLISNGTNYANSVVTATSTNRRYEGTRIKDCIISCSEGVDGYATRLDSGATDLPRGTEEYPIVFDNCVFLKTGIQTVRIGNGADSNVQFNNCTFGEGRVVGRVAAAIIDAGKTYKVSWTNCIRLDDGADITYNPGSDTTLIAGPSNLSLHTGTSDNYWPGSLTYTATTDTSVSSTGSQMIYDPSTLALINVSGNDAVGVGTGSAINVPVTDILGNSRIRGASNEYVDPGAYSVDNITTTKTIGIGGAASGFDFGTFLEAEAAVDTTAIVYDNNLAKRNLAVVFEARAGTYSEHFTISNSLTCDPTRNVTYQSAAGGQAVIGDTHPFGLILITDGAFTTLRRLTFGGTATGASGRAVEINPASGATCEGCLLDSLTFERLGGTGVGIVLNAGATSGGAGSATNPTVIQNCVELGVGQALNINGTASDEIHVNVVNCTFAGTGLIAIGINTTNGVTINSVNNVNLGHNWSWRDALTTGTVTATGSNNFGGSNQPFPDALQAEGQTWTFTTDTTASSTGNQVIYTSATGALINVSGNDAVGVGTATGVPTTDINGVSRIRGDNNEYTDPGAFTTDLVTFNRKIGPFREYTTFNDAESDVVAISTDGNLAQRNEAIVFEADAGEYGDTHVDINSSLITDPTNNVTYRGPKYGGLDSSAVIVNKPIYIFDKHTVLENMSFKYTNNTGVGPNDTCTIKNCGFFGKGSYGNGYLVNADGTEHVKFENCMFSLVPNVTGSIASLTNGGTIEFLNCTFINDDFSIGGPHQPFMAQAGDGKLIANNVVNGTGKKFMYSSNQTPQKEGSNNYSEDTGEAARLPNQTDTQFSYDVTAVPTGGDQMCILDSNTPGQMLAVSGNDIIGVGSVSSAPTTDINGTSRLRGVGTQYVDPGAFTSEVNTITKTIGIGGAASGFDFGGFTEAEAAVDTTAIVYDSNLVKKNLAVVFEADAGTYIEYLQIQSGLTTDPTRNVTYKAAAGSEHGGIDDAGVLLEQPPNSNSGNIRIYDGYVHLDNLDIKATRETQSQSINIGLFAGSLGFTATNCIFRGLATGGTQSPRTNITRSSGLDQPNPEDAFTSENCIFSTSQQAWGFQTSPIVNGTSRLVITNCTMRAPLSADAPTAFVRYSPLPESSQTFLLDFNNNLNTTASKLIWDPFMLYDPATNIITGSGNVTNGINTSETLGGTAILAGNQYWTLSTDTTAASTGNQAIYTSATGALINVSGNDAIGVGSGSAINVPVTDILGKSRLRGLSNEYADPGAFTTDIETTTLTANPGTLSSLILNLTPYITTTNIAKRNESIVIELTKADYPHLNFSNPENIIGDKTRNITIKPEEGAHHKGIRGAGIRFVAQINNKDNLFFEDVSGLALEGVEIYKPSGDIGRHGLVIRDSEGMLFKDVILNDLEVSSHSQTMMGSTYRNGFLSPISFKNCLHFCRSSSFYVASFAPRLGGKYELVNCTLSSVSNTTPAIKMDSAGGEGTMELNLVNNLILSPHRNFNINIGNGGDGFAYGSNNTGPDTPNYQLNDAVRASVYPILPTFDYTPIPSSPAAVYRPGTLQLLDIPDNDVLQLGVGTDDPLVPLQGIGEDSRSTSSCNPGCWEDNYELVDLRINTFDGSTGIVDPYFGPPTDIANAVLPDATVPVFIVIGDSTAQGFSVEINDARSYRQATDYWPTNAFDGSAYGYFWNKYMTTPDNGVTWTRDISYISPDTSGDAFLPINPRMGGIGVGTFTYSDPLPVSTVPAGNCSPLWDFSLAISGIFRNPAGETLTPHFIFIASTGSRLGSNGPTFLGNDEYNFSPSGYLFNTLNQSYIKPAVDHLMNNGKHPLLVGTLIMTGGTEANISYNPTPDGSKVSTSGAATYANFLSATEAATKVSGRAPWIAYEVWDSTSSDYPEVYSKFMQKALYGLKDIRINRRINMQNLERDKGTTAQNTDIHFVQYRYPDYGRQFAGAYRALLTWRRSPIFGRTLSEIFNE